MYQKTSKGLARIQEKVGRLRILFPRELFAGKLKTMALGLPASEEGYREAERRLKAIQADIDLGQFDPTLDKYRPQSKRESYLKVVRELYPEIDLPSLWNKYLDYKRSHLKETTFFYLETTLGRKIEESGIKSPYQALELRSWLLTNTTESMTKRIIVYVNAAFKFGLKHKLVKAPNPFEGMSAEFKHNWETEAKPSAFNASEKGRVLAAFSTHRIEHGGASYAHYTNFVHFLFSTGCRPNEAVGIRWGDISADYRKITFNGGIVYKGGRSYRVKGSKNNRRREFPCNQELQQLLRSLKPAFAKADNLLFTSPRGTSINYNNFRRRAWETIVDPIKTNTTPYSCRDTFITEQISKGIAPAIIAKWVDTSVGMIEKHYLDNDSISHILPQ